MICIYFDNQDDRLSLNAVKPFSMKYLPYKDVGGKIPNKQLSQTYGSSNSPIDDM